MTKYLYALIFLFLFLGSKAQISITENDMPASGDTLRMSNSNGFSIGSSLPTGTDTTWDYSIVTPTSQEVIELTDIAQMPFTYQATFNNPLDPSHKAAYAILTNDSFNIPNMQISDFYSFIRKTSTEYGVIGYGLSLSGFPVPGKYDNLEVFYQFPLDYGDTSSSHSIASQTVPSLGFFQREVVRSNHVDGWGTLKTPYGTFDVLRMRSEVLQKDSVKFDSLPAFPAITTQKTEIRFIGKGHGLPLMTIEQQNGFTISVQYQDSVRNLGTGIAVMKQKESLVYPNPVVNDATISWSADFTELKVYNALGKLIYDAEVRGIKQFILNHSIWPASGIYFLELRGKNIYSRKRIVKR